MGDEAAPAPAAEPAKTTTSGAQGLFQTNAWLTAAAVAAYSTRALWLKMRSLLAGDKEAEDSSDSESGEQPNPVTSPSEMAAEVEYGFEEPQPPGLMETEVVKICPT
ncbi:hypothetical protein KR044_003315 [Drosophila immigrans]|nr:hypothetical protein KR044_003315 [Drosophila immigrans]